MLKLYNWTEGVRISDSNQRDYRPSIIMDSLMIMIAWVRTSNGVHYRSSLDGGYNWQDIERLEWFSSASALCKLRPDSIFIFYSD
jgi:hypothetical protein